MKVRRIVALLLGLFFAAAALWMLVAPFHWYAYVPGVTETGPANVQPGEPVATAGAAEENRPLVAYELAAAAGEDGRPAGETCALLLAFAGRRTSESEAVRQHAENDRDVAAAGRLANQDRRQTSARKPSSGEVSAARQTGAGKTSSGCAERPKRAVLPPQTSQRDLRLTV